MSLRVMNAFALVAGDFDRRRSLFAGLASAMRFSRSLLPMGILSSLSITMSHTDASHENLLKIVERLKDYYESVSFFIWTALCDKPY